MRRFLWRLWLNPMFCRWWDRWFPAASTGAWGERIAERYLLKQGHWIIARNVRTRASEIDLVTLDGRTLVFVEVKTRSSKGRSSGLEAVDSEKQQRLSRAAASYLHRHQLDRQAARFDVLAITIDRLTQNPTVVYVRNAFESWRE